MAETPTPKAKLGEAINHKLGPHIHGWSLPADETCPGASQLCRVVCYALRGHFRHGVVKHRLEQNEAFSRTPDFVPWMIAALRANNVRALRVHVSGDFYDTDYVEKWQKIVTASRRVLFFAYTRSWLIEEMFPELIRLYRRDNVSGWFSFDRETGSPPLVPGVRRAYMAINDLDASNAPNDADLVFRERPKTPMKHANGVLVCPAENAVPGVWRHTCTTCRICWGSKRKTRWELAFAATGDDEGIEIDVPEQLHVSGRKKAG